jgi:hypothetical protein
MKRGRPEEISVFIASPGDLAPERKVFKDTIDSLNGGFADGAGVRFIPLGWEDVLAETGLRTQSVINEDIERCDVFFLALHRRWGQPAPDSKYSSYTEEEFQLALKLWKKTKSPQVFVFFKSVDSASVADPGVELAKVLAFRKSLEAGRHTLIRTFNSETDFGSEVDRHLRAVARGDLQQLDHERRPVEFPQGEVSALSRAAREGAKRVKRAEGRAPSAAPGGRRRGVSGRVAKADLSLVEAHQTELTMARAAMDAAKAGHQQDARILFAKATEATTDLTVLSVAAEFFRQVGDLENATKLVQRQAAIGRDRTIAARHYLALVPQGFMKTVQDQMLDQMLAQAPPEAAEELRSINEEVYGGGRLDEIMLKLMVKHYSTEEIVQLTRFLASPEGQSSLQKQQAMMTEAIEIGNSEYQRVWRERHPEDADDE